MCRSVGTCCRLAFSLFLFSHAPGLLGPQEMPSWTHHGRNLGPVNWWFATLLPTILTATLAQQGDPALTSEPPQLGLTEYLGAFTWIASFTCNDYASRAAAV
ncbi:hypothetical protein BD289DRAFT_192168 [Coniella lustricola]|uniref:Uncharacterized protein n=1 Tax=Coniella lustricola TaxID=2025994 RepID=A0A2T3ALY0_9PEZI|nr:hypothetical protein BD289DRAFT_192168 [Coniella lustricola]